jgi:hypothetical protein
MIEGLVTGLGIVILTAFLWGVYELLRAIGFIRWKRKFEKKHNTLYQWIIMILFVIPSFGIFLFFVILMVG